MIFLTVGSALPFDRLVEMVDRAVESGLVADDVFAQVGDGRYAPRSLRYVKFLSRPEYSDAFAAADAVISHAGIGTISHALRAGKPLLVLPRDPRHGELVDDHQLKTARTFSDLGHILMFTDLSQLGQRLEELRGFTPLPRHPNVDGVAQFIGRELSAYLERGDRVRRPH